MCWSLVALPFATQFSKQPVPKTAKTNTIFCPIQARGDKVNWHQTAARPTGRIGERPLRVPLASHLACPFRRLLVRGPLNDAVWAYVFVLLYIEFEHAGTNSQSMFVLKF